MHISTDLILASTTHSTYRETEKQKYIAVVSSDHVPIIISIRRITVKLNTDMQHYFNFAKSNRIYFRNIIEAKMLEHNYLQKCMATWKTSGTVLHFSNMPLSHNGGTNASP